jgi:hypothetical protein
MLIALALQMGHELKDTLHDCWSRLRQLHNPFYSETMARDRILHVLRFLHLEKSQRPDEGKEYDWLWKLRTLFDKLNKPYSKFYNPSGHLAVDEVTVKFKGRVIFSQEEGAPEGDPSYAGKMEWCRMWQGWDVETGKWSP